MNRSHRAMRMDDYETYMELVSVIQEMDDFVDAVVVEGIHDKEALQEMGVTSALPFFQIMTERERGLTRN